MTAPWITSLMFISVSLLTLASAMLDLRLVLSLPAGSAGALKELSRRAGRQPRNLPVQRHQAA